VKQELPLLLPCACAWGQSTP